MRVLLVLCPLFAASVLFAGCSGGPSDTPEVGLVSGTVTLDGQPAANLQVAFQPESGRPSLGRTDSAGKYTLSYSASTTGAKVGKGLFKISTAVPESGDEESGEDVPETLPKRYNVEAGKNPDMAKEIVVGEQTIDFVLESK